MSGRNHKKKSGKAGRSKAGPRKREKDSGLIDTRNYPGQFMASPTMVIWRNPGRLDPYPQRYRTVVTTAIRGVVPAGTGAQQWYCRLNSVLVPFASGTWTGALPAIATLNPTGHSLLCNALFYQNFRVISSRITLEMASASAVDVIVLCVTPSLSGSTPTSTATAMGQQFTKTKLIQMGQPASSCTIVNKMSEATLSGVPKRAVEYDLSGNLIGNYAAQPGDVNYWIINFVREDGGVTAAALGYRCILEHEVEYFGDGLALEPETAVANFQPMSHPKTAAEPTAPVEEKPSKLLDAYLAARENLKKK